MNGAVLKNPGFSVEFLDPRFLNHGGPAVYADGVAPWGFGGVLQNRFAAFRLL